MAVIIQLRRDTAANWTFVNPVLRSGELGIERDTGKAKLGDGTTTWGTLAYWNPSGASGGGGAVSSVNGHTGTVVLGASDVGADASGAATAAQAAAIAASLQKSANLSDLASAATARTNLGLGSAATQASSAFDASGAASTEQTRALAAEALLAPKASPALTGTPTAPTATALTNTTQVATTAYADAAVGVETTRAQAAETLGVLKANNLSDLASASTARTNLGLTGAATAALPLSAANGGTGQVTQQAAMDALAGAQTSAQYLRGNGTHVLMSAIQSADLPAATTSTQGAVILDGTAGDIKSTSTAAVAGAAGKAADASHVHVQDFGGLFGDGSDGSVTFDGTTTILGLVPAANVYTMTRDIFCTGITVNNGVTLKTNGWRIFCAGTVTNNGTISSIGGNATGGNNSTGGAAAGGAVLATFAGANGGNGAGAQGSNSGTQWGTGTGNTGGTGSGGAGGAARAQRTSSAPFRNPAHALSGSGGWQGTAFQVSGGAGGSAGGGDGTNAGGGGGGGGGIVVIVAWAVNNGSGTISAAAGNGGTPSVGNCGGGGGGGGGLILIYTLAAWTAGTTSVAGGTQGSGVGTGTAGSAGGSGSVLNVVVQ